MEYVDTVFNIKYENILVDIIHNEMSFMQYFLRDTEMSLFSDNNT